MKMVKLLRDSTYGSKGDSTQVSDEDARRLIENKVAVAVIEHNRGARTKPDNKALSAAS